MHDPDTLTEGEGGPRLSAEQIGYLLEDLDDPLRLRRQLVRLAKLHPHLAVADPRHLGEDLIEAMRLAREAAGRPGPAAQRRYRALELLLVERLSPAEAAAALHTSVRTLYRARYEGLEELAPVLEEIWSNRAATPGRAGAPRGETAESEGVPRPQVFVGRLGELGRATQLLEAQHLLVIGGPAGIGKTTFAAMLAQQQATMRPVLWHRLRPGLSDSVGGVLLAIGQRLARLGSEELLTFLHEATTSSVWQALAHNLAVASLEQHHLVMFLDDADTIARNPEVCSLLTSFASDCPTTRVVVVARERMPLLENAARLEVFGLEEDAARAFLAAHSLGDLPPSAVRVLLDETGGNPQLLYLAAGALLHGELAPDSLHDRLLEVPDVQAFFFDRIYRQLSPDEQLVLGAASLLQLPVTGAFLAGALEGLAESIPSTLAVLGERFLMTTSLDGLRLHSTVREFARRMLSAGTARTLHRRFASAYQRAGHYDEACHHWLEIGETEEARRALLAVTAAQQPHTRARLLHLLQRLVDAGLEMDPELIRLRDGMRSTPRTR